MPENPFLKFQQYESKPPRNTVDLSHRVNGTYAFGYEYPVLCLEVNPGETFSIESAFGLKFMPMPFPVQTPMRAQMQFFYVRTRTVWPEFVDFIYNNKSPDRVPHPFIQRPASDHEFWKTGGIADHFGIPTEVFQPGLVSSVSRPIIGLSSTSNDFLSTEDIVRPSAFVPGDSVNSPYIRPIVILFGQNGGTAFNVPTLSNIINYDPLIVINSQATDSGPYFGIICGGYTSPISDYTFKFEVAADVVGDVAIFVFAKGKDVPLEFMTCLNFGYPSGHNYGVITGHVSNDGNSVAEVVIDSRDQVYVDQLFGSLNSDQELYFFIGTTSTTPYVKSFLVPDPSQPLLPGAPQPGYSVISNVSTTDQTGIADNPLLNPFAGDNPLIGLSAIPFRCYEAVYNAYIRNERLEPLMIDGEPEYNKFSPSMDSGADTFPYRLYKRNWEPDFLTTALPSPQQGIAPVVGVTGLSNVQIQDPDTNEIYNFSAEVAEDGETLVGGSFHDPQAPLSVRRTAADLVTAGFTINDFRNVSALQRWLENNLRRGLKYRDQVMANTGVKPRFDELDMPEFIGGFSRNVTVQSVTQTAPGGDAGLGDYAGQANCFGSSKHRINHYCDEAGFIIGIMCVTPTPVYSQLLPKHFLKRTALDYHHPAFNHIGMQPICYDEVCPLQVFQSNPSQASSRVKFSDVFGYQRPYYDLLQHVDTVHGKMRTSLRNYVMNRTFSGVPELGADFIHVDPQQLNDVFTVQNDEDVIMGEIYFRIYAKRPVSLFGQPKIV